jgi:rhodanese-related sulfurtransferase
MDKISMQDLYGHMDKLGKEEIVLDVRTPEEYSTGHVPGSLNIPVDQLEGRTDELKKYSKIFVHCKMGGRAEKASALLESWGVDKRVWIAGSGMQAWIEEGFPVEN